jgi:hypothetical protein
LANESLCDCSSDRCPLIDTTRPVYWLLSGMADGGETVRLKIVVWRR